MLEWVEVRRAAKKYSFHVKTKDKMNAATIPGNAMGRMMVTKAPQIDRPSTSAASSNSVGIEENWSRMIQITMGSTDSVYSKINPIRVSKSASSLYKTSIGSAKTTGGKISCDRKKNEISLLRIHANL